MNGENLYDLLGVRSNATISEIKYAYKRNLHKYHPDINKNSSGTNKFKKIIKAYKIIGNPQKRAIYDKRLKNSKNNILNSKNPKMKTTSRYAKKTSIFKDIFGIFDKNKLRNYFEKIKKRRLKRRRKRFIELEKEKLEIQISSEFQHYLKLTDIELKARLRISSNHFLKANTVKAIAMRKEKKYFSDLVKLLSGNSDIVKIEVIKALGSLRDYRAISFLTNLIDSRKKEIRYEVAKVLRNFEDTRSITALLKLLEDKHEDIICEAMLSLGVLGDSDVLVEIRKLLRHPSLKVKKTSLKTIRVLK